MTTNTARKAARMDNAQEWAAPAAPRLAGLLLAAAASAALAGCGVNYASSDPVIAPDYHQRHPIVLAQAPTSIEIYPIGGGLDSQSLADLRAFADRYRRLGGGQIAILTPARQGSNAKAVYDIRKTLSAAGIGGTVAISSYPVADRRISAPIRVAYLGIKATVPTPCGQWPADLASGSSLQGWKNDSYWNYGCATQSVLAAQVDDPRDLVQARAIDAPDVAMRLRAIGKVRNGEDPGTDWKVQTTTIGQVGSF
jgi:pilus assembly protein CpaD